MRKRLAVLIIVLSLVLITFITITAVILYNGKDNNDSNPQVSNDSNPQISNSTSDAALINDQLAVNDIEQYIENNNDSIIEYDKSDSTDINLPESVLQGIEPYTSVEERECVSTLLNDWVDSFNGDINKVQFLASNYGAGFDEIVIRVSYEDKYASICYTGSDGEYTGYVSDIDF